MPHTVSRVPHSVRQTGHCHTSDIVMEGMATEDGRAAKQLSVCGYSHALNEIAIERYLLERSIPVLTWPTEPIVGNRPPMRIGLVVSKARSRRAGASVTSGRRSQPRSRRQSPCCRTTRRRKTGRRTAEHCRRGLLAGGDHVLARTARRQGVAAGMPDRGTAGRRPRPGSSTQ